MTAESTPIQVPLVNGVVWSFAHITLEIAGLEFTGGFKDISYKRERKREIVYSNSPDPVGKTLGQNEYEASAEVYLAWWLATLRAIEANLGPGYGDQSFTTFVKYNAAGFDPFVDEIQNCTFDSTDAKNGVGTGAITRMVNFNPTKILFDQTNDLANPLVSEAQ